MKSVIIYFNLFDNEVLMLYVMGKIMDQSHICRKKNTERNLYAISGKVQTTQSIYAR